MSDTRMFFKGNSSRLQQLIEKIQANKENHNVSQQEIHEALGTEAGSSWSSEGHSSPPSSCATPNSASDLPDSELTFTVGVTDATPYACQFCDKAFPRLSYLKKHEQTHSEHLPFVCEFCKRRFKHKRSKDRHLKLHTGDKRYKCAQCEAAFARSDHLKIHMKTHDNQKPFQCTICNRGYNTAAALTSHMQNHKKISDLETQSSGSSYRCLECAQIFSKPDDLTAHIMNEHRRGSSPPKKHKSPRPRLACIYCTKDSFHSMEALQIHVQAMHGSILNGSQPFIFSHAQLNNSNCSTTSSANSRNMTCHLCTMTFPTVQALHIHATSAHGLGQSCENDFQCSRCGITLPSYAWLVEHFNISHRSITSTLSSSAAEQSKPTDLSVNRKEQQEKLPSAKKFKSSSNSLTPPNITNASQGALYDHPGVLLCNQCNAALPDFESFRSHLKSHLEQSVFLKMPQLRHTQTSVCPYCGVHIVSSQEMIQHMEIHFKSLTEDFECQICFQAFKLSEELQKHLLETHTQHLYRCSLCKDMFESKVAIQVHYAMKHCNEKKKIRCSVCLSLGPFQSETEFSHHVKSIHCSSISTASSPSVSPPRVLRCVFCNATFATDVDFQFHLAIHTKQFQCNICNESFHVEYLLEKHVQTNHSSTKGSTVKCEEADEKPNDLTYEPNTTNDFPSNSMKVSTDNIGNGTVGNITSNNVNSTNESPLKRQDYMMNNNVFNGVCDICECGNFTSECDLQAHRKLLHNVKTSLNKIPNINSSSTIFKGTCDICELKNFSSEAELLSHRQMMHHLKPNSNSKLSLHCAYCKETCKSRTDLENHMKAHCQSAMSSNKYKCNICDEMCHSASVLAEHKLTHCKVVFGSVCTHCKAQIHNEESFIKHVMQHTNNAGNTMSKGQQQLVLPVACVICRQTLGSEMETRLHAKFHLQVELIPCSMCLQGCDKKELKDRICTTCQKLNKTSTKCSKCNIKFETHGAMELHMLMVHDQSDNCKKCNEKYESQKEYELHMETHFSNENNNSGTKCNLCMLVFPGSIQLQLHLIEHTFMGCSNYTCYICSSVFTTAVGLQSHILEHGLSARPYDCPKCMKKFFFRAELDNHSALHAQTFIPKTSQYDKSSRQTETPKNDGMKEHDVAKLAYNDTKKKLHSFESNNFDQDKTHNENSNYTNKSSSKEVHKCEGASIKLEVDSVENSNICSSQYETIKGAMVKREDE
ncbi:zinc finger protein 423 homolog isoform X2 [Cimex lectularius]|uniref:C2H2-type domain-containing protein n=1 Tax=Cimex lectularius TaxID=79782 RepID=A0A8I6REU4_CIMLE|nr:zinc finger protein 423 homolog isoform X2 [Cimex lectularius]